MVLQCLPFIHKWAEAETDDGGKGSADGQNTGQEHGIVGSSVPEKMEEQGDEGGTGGLTHKTGRSQHTAGTSGAVIGGRAEQHVVVGRLEETEAGSAHHQPPCYVKMRGILRNK